MTRKHPILETKLNELETILDEALLLGPESQTHEDIKTKLGFIRTLLSTEVVLDPTKPHQLLHISDRLDSMEKSFHEWDTQRTVKTEDFEKYDSGCSCTESCLNDDDDGEIEGEDSGMTIYDNPLGESSDIDDEKAIKESSGNGVSEIRENERERFNLENDDKVGIFVYEDANEFFKDFVKDNKKVVEMEKEDNELGSEEEKEEGSGKSGIWKNCCSMTSGFVIGMILMSYIMVSFSDCFYYYDDEQASFAFPT